MEAPAAEPRHQRALVAVCAADFVVIGALAVPITVALSRHLTDIRLADATWTAEQGLSRVFVAGALTSLTMQILFGWLGDRARISQYGRLPYLVGGTILGALGMWQAGQATTLGSVVLWFALAICGYAATLASIHGTFADTIDGGRRARAAGWLAAAAGGATVVPLGIYALLPITDFTAFGLFPLVACFVATAAAVVLFPHVRAAGSRTSPHASIDDRTDNLPNWRSQFWLLVVQRALAQLAFVFGAIYPFLFLVRRVGLDADLDSTSHWASGAAAAADLLGVIAAVGAGYVATRTMNALRPMRAGLTLLIIGLFAMAFATTTWQYVVAQLIIGFGGGAYFGCDLGLVFRVVPPSAAGRYLGFFNIARNLPQTIGPALGPILLAVGSGDRIGADRSQNYTAYFLAATVVAMTALLATKGLRVRSADTEVVAVVR